MATLISSMVSMAGLYVAIASQRRQLAMQIMLQYSEKFRVILQSMPMEMMRTRHGTEEDLPESGGEVTRYAVQLFYVLFELHYLRQKRYLPLHVWQLWMPNLETVLRSPLLVREWRFRRSDFTGHHSFCRFIDSVQRGH